MATTGPLKWDETSKRTYEAGVDHGILFPTDPTTGAYKAGVAWNGLTKVSESPDGGDTDSKYANNNIYLNMTAPEKFKGTISAYTYPAEFAACDGSASVIDSKTQTEILGLKVTGQTRLPFGFSYRTGMGNDTNGMSYGYKLHIVYNATAAVSSRDYETINDSPDAIELSWDFNTTPIPIPGMRPSAHLVIESTTANAKGLKALEDILIGSESAASKLPTPEEVIAALKTAG